MNSAGLRLSVVAAALLAGSALVTAGRTSEASATTAPSGAVYAWGDNDAGQLGVGTITVHGHNYDTNIPEPTHMPTGTLAVSLAGGQSHSLAVTTAGSVYAWGFAGDGQLGTGNNQNTTLPVAVEMPPGVTATAVAAGYKQSYALTSTGGVYAWGWNIYGQLGTGSTKTKANVPAPVELPSGVTAGSIAAGGNHGLTVGSDGNVYTWGLNVDGQLGNGSTTNTNVPVAVRLPGGASPVAVAGGDEHSLALTSSGQVYAWGDNTYGQLGDSTTLNSATPVQVSLPSGVSAVAIAAGANYSLALTSAGQIYGWGDNVNGTIGDGTTMNRDVPTLSALPGGVTATGIVAGGNRAHALTSNGQVFDWGSTETGTNVHLDPHVDTLPVGETPVLLGDGPDAEQYLVLMVPQSGSVYAWGDNDSGQLGVGSYQDSRVWQPSQMPSGSQSVALAGGQSSSVAATTTGDVYSWGYNFNGQLGDGNTTNTTVPVQTEMPAGVVATQLAAGWDQELALTTTGSVYAWGLNRYGELGNGSTQKSLVPGTVSFPAGVSIAAVAAGAFHSLALSTTGQIYAWGSNASGQLGNGTTTDSWVPVPISLPGGVAAVAIAGGDNDSLAVANTGAVYAWGDNSYGQLGNGTTTSSDIPVKVQLPSGVKAQAVAAGGSSPSAQPPGGDYSLALTTKGGIYAWGSNAIGQLGDNSTVGSDIPVVTQLPAGVTVVEIAAGSNYAHALSTSGDIYYWGTQARGKDPEHVPVVSALPTGLRAISISAGPDAEQELALMVSE